MNTGRGTLAVATVLMGLSAGFFFAYQFSVIRGLADVDDETYVTTFRALNDTIRNPYFGIVFFGTVPTTALALALNWHRPPARWAIITALTFYLGCMAITVAGNVPLNDELATTTAGFAEARVDFEGPWNRLNLVRTIAVTAGFAALAAGGVSTVRGTADRTT